MTLRETSREEFVKHISEDKADAFHNLGNVFLSQKKYEQSITAYKEALKLRPNDMDTKYNLAYAQEMIKKEQQQNQENQNQENQEENQEENQNKENQNEEKKEPQENKEQKELTKNNDSKSQSRQ